MESLERRFACLREPNEIPQDAQSDVARFFGMKLHARHPAALHDRGEGLTMFRDGDSIGGHRGDETVGEVHLRLARYALDDRRLATQVERVPSDVRNLHRSIAASAARQPGAAA